MTEENNTPAIRFKDSMESWKEYKLKDFTNEVTRTDPGSTSPIMMITAGSGFVEQSERYSFDNAGESLKKYTLLEKGELAYNHGASKLRPYGSCFALTTSKSARVPFVYHCFDVGGNDPEFIALQLNGKNVEAQLRKLVSSSARMDGLLNISFDEYRNILVFFPDLKEQLELSNWFRELDKLITLNQQKYDKLCNFKKAMLEKMFPKEGESVPEIRFEGFDEPWEQCELQTLYSNAGSGGTPLSSVDEYYDGNIPFLSIADINGRYIDTTTKTISQKGLESSAAWIVPAGSIALAMYASVGKTGILRLDAATSQAFFNMIFTSESTRNFVFSRLEKAEAESEWEANISTGTQRNLNAEKVKKWTILSPGLKEQQQIGSLFEALDSLITLNQQKYDKLCNFKKALLDKMFV